MVNVESITRITVCDTAERFLEELEPYPSKGQRGPELPSGLFRGHASDAWFLQPSALRDDAFERIFAPESELFQPLKQRFQLQAELRVISEFVDHADSIGLPIPNDSMEFREDLDRISHRLLSGADHSDAVIWPPRRLHAALALARHSGLPTRLLDWTSDPMKGAYFAAAKAAPIVAAGKSEVCGSKRLSVWAVDRKRFVKLIHLSRNIGSRLDEQVTVPVEFFSVPRSANPNANAQSGWFSVVRLEHDLDDVESKKPLDAVIAEALAEKEVRPVFRKYTLPVSEARRLLWLLAVRGVNASSVFPDYRGAATCVSELRLYDPSDRARE